MRRRNEAVGELYWSETREETRATERAASSAVAGDLHALFFAVRERRPLRCASPAGGEIVLTWF